jgi:hypothetical protein
MTIEFNDILNNVMNEKYTEKEKEKLNNLKNKFMTSLNQYKIDFVEYKVHSNNANKNRLVDSEKKLNDIYRELFEYENKILSGFDEINSYLGVESNLLKKSKKYNNKLKKEENEVLSSDKSSLPRYFDKLYELRLSQVKIGFYISGILLFSFVFFKHIKKED